MPIDICLAKEGDSEEGWQEHLRFDGVRGTFERWYHAWKQSGASVEVSRDLAYHDEQDWVAAKRDAQALLDLVV